ncbi:acyl-CoA dehydrogenase family protein [Pseudomonas sp. PICF6]|uniref:acyl-CoA dehydrogenase family protein n=1 Tax=Pseudomonas sp. PICF6 TaxID=2664172 RepID=UPI001371350D|nr:acyl-CoA dehydrogenase family protein [Pseudomonas sp. PICF6]MXR29731.1 hypothetical protein [Pseudomonas sp. PICF6]
MIFTQEHAALRRTVRQFVDQQINPYVDEWEKAGRFPIHEVFREAGELGLLGISKPEQFGGMGLDYSYSIVAAEEFGTIHCGGVPMSIGVQTDMCTPALARFGSDELREAFLRPAISGEQVGCIGVSEVGAGSDVAGFMMQMLQFQEERLFGAANMLKGLEHCIDSTIEYCKERKTFGTALIDNQVIHFRLAELASEIECLRALVYQATEQYINGQDVTRLASMAKLKAGRLAREVTDSCLQYWGGMGFMWDNPVARAYRDVRLVSIGAGADEIMLGIICKLMGILPGKKK